MQQDMQNSDKHKPSGKHVMGDSSSSNPAKTRQNHHGQESAVDKTGPDTDRRQDQLDPFCHPLQMMQTCGQITDVYGVVYE